MKKVFTIFLLILSSAFLFAQEEGDPEDLIEIEAEGRTFQQIADSLFQYLDPLKIPFGVLTNRVYAGDRLSSFSNGDTIRAENLKQTFWDLEQATLPYTGFVSRYTEVNDSLFNQINRGELPIMIIDYNISSIKEDAYDIGALIIGEDGLPREGDSELSAYETGSCLVAGLAAKQAYANKPYHFTLKHILSNTSYEISQVNIIDLSSQDQWVVLPERETEVIFTETGNRYFKIQVQFNNRETSSFIFF